MGRDGEPPGAADRLLRRLRPLGATCQSGAAAVSALVARNMPVRVLMRPHRGAAPVVPAGCELAPGDITRPDTLAAGLDGVTGIVNCVGVGHDLRTRPATIEAVEVSGNRNLIEAAVAAGQAPHVVYLSGRSTSWTGAVTPPRADGSREAPTPRQGMRTQQRPCAASRKNNHCPHRRRACP